jgi:kynurenine formamidase
MPIIDCAQTIEPHFHWRSHSFVSQDPGRGDEFQEYGLKWRGEGFSFISAPGWRIAGASRLDDHPLETVAGLASVVDATGPRIGPDDLRRHLANPARRRILILRTGHTDRFGNGLLDYWREVPVFAPACAALIAAAGYAHVILDVPCNNLPPRRPLFDQNVPNPNFAFRAALHGAGLLVTENACNLSAIQQAEVFALSLPLAIPRQPRPAARSCTPNGRKTTPGCLMFQPRCSTIGAGTSMSRTVRPATRALTVTRYISPCAATALPIAMRPAICGATG